jgi:hypothetical protein
MDPGCPWGLVFGASGCRRNEFEGDPGGDDEGDDCFGNDQFGFWAHLLAFLILGQEGEVMKGDGNLLKQKFGFGITTFPYSRCDFFRLSLLSSGLVGLSLFWKSREQTKNLLLC